MSNLNSWLNRISLSLVNRICIFFFSFASYFVLVRFFEKGDFGIYNLYFILVTFTEMTRTAFLQNGFIKYYLDENHSTSQVAGSSLLLNIALTSLFALGLIILAEPIGNTYHSKELASMLKTYAISSFFLIPFSQLSYLLNAKADFLPLSILSAMRYGSYFILSLITYFFWSHYSLVDLARLHGLSFLIGSVTILLLGKKTYFHHLHFNKDQFLQLFHFGKYTFGTGVTSMLTRSVDQLMIGYFITNEAVASFNVAGRFMNFIEIPIASISQAVYPQFAKLKNQPNYQIELKRLYEKSTGMMLAAIAPFILLILIFPSFCIYVIAGSQYLDAIPILQVFIAFNLFKPLGTQAGSVLETIGKPKVIFYALIGCTVVNILFNYLLIPIEGPLGGMMGAAIASVLSGTFFLTTCLFYLHKQTPISIKGLLLNFSLGFKIGISIINQKLRKSHS